RVLARLKDVQRASVDYVFRRLYAVADPTHRFLIADEVGLGKTLVAKGIIAKVIERLWSGTDRIDIVYICSNAEIARQNISRLNITPDDRFALASRITLLPTRVRDLKGRRLNFISLTPSTSFELKSSLGRQEERALLHYLLARAWSLGGTGSLNVLQGNASSETFRATVRSFREDEDIDDTLAEAFARTLQETDSLAAREGRSTLRARFDDLCQRFERVRKNVPPEDQRDRRELVCELRVLLATTCLEALEPDLVILDETHASTTLSHDLDPPNLLAR